MYLREYEYILAISRERSMRKAAETLYISQPALSRLVQEVESRVGAPLFDRSGRELVPTDIGRDYIAMAERIVSMNNDFQRSLGQKTSSIDQLQLVMPMVWATGFINAVIPEYHKEKPDIKIGVEIAGQRRLTDMLMERRATIAAGIMTKELQQELACYPVRECDMALVVPKGHPLEAAAERQEGEELATVPVSTLENINFILSGAESYTGRFNRRFFMENKVQPKIVCEVMTTSAVLSIVANGIGVSILPALSVKHSSVEDRVTCLAVKGCSNKRTFGFMTLKGYELHPEEEYLIELAKTLY